MCCTYLLIMRDQDNFTLHKSMNEPTFLNECKRGSCKSDPKESRNCKPTNGHLVIALVDAEEVQISARFYILSCKMLILICRAAQSAPKSGYITKIWLSKYVSDLPLCESIFKIERGGKRAW